MILKLSDRMQAIADQVRPDDVVADIGTDHGYIPIWLTINNRCRYAILADINKGPLKKAAESIRKYAADETYDIRLGSGIEVLKPGEADTVIIAGMGGILITNILQADIEKTKLFKKMILQPRNNSDILRKWLKTLDGFAITCEQVIKEVDKYSEIITVTALSNLTHDEKERVDKAAARELEMEIPSDFFDDIPAMYLDSVNDTVLEYLEKRLSVSQYIIESIISKGQTETSASHLKEVQQKKGYIEKFLQEAKNVKS